MKSNAERQKAYRERKKAEKAALKDMQAAMPPAVEADRQAPIDRATELQQQPVFEWHAPPPCVVEGHPDDLPPVKIEPETITYFDVYKRRHYRMFK